MKFSPAEITGLRYGVAYYPEYHRFPRTLEDLDLMQAANINVIRVGESVWSTWEPQDGEFDLEWLAPVLDAAHERGIAVILGTPTYAIPPWLQVAHPEIAAEHATGSRVPWGARQEIDFSNPTFLQRAERVIRAILERYSKHPSIIGYQVDNEPGLFLLHNEGVFARFLIWLESRYGDVDNLNREWGLTYWSHKISNWSELWRPDGNSFPQYDLAWRTFQAELTTEFISWQADLVREYKSENQFVTTCIQFNRPALDDRTLAASLDINAANPYYAMQDRFDVENQDSELTPWTSTGVASLFRQGDRMFASKQERFLVTETNAQAIGGPDMNHPPYPGQLKQAAYALVARGAAMIEYWHWHTLPYGAETYWGGVLPHSLVPGRVYREVADIGSEFAKINQTLDGFEPDFDVTVLWSTASRFAFEYSPPLQKDSEPDLASYQRIVDAFHNGVIASGRQSRFMHVEQALTLGAAELARRHPVLVAAGLYITTDDQLKLLQDYVAAGGHLVVGPRTAYADQEARARIDTAPPQLAELAGASYEEFSNISEPIMVRANNSSLKLGSDAAAQSWVDGLIASDAEVLASYEHPRFGDFPAVTRRSLGIGSITIVGCVPNVSLAKGIMELVSPQVVSRDLAMEIKSPVYVASGSVKGGRRVWFIFNWGWQMQEITLKADVLDAVSGESLNSASKISLTGWSTRTFVSR
jgi:beta-galactosidase